MYLGWPGRDGRCWPGGPERERQRRRGRLRLRFGPSARSLPLGYGRVYHPTFLVHGDRGFPDIAALVSHEVLGGRLAECGESAGQERRGYEDSSFHDRAS
jgi:hypothetical protein